MPARSDNGDSGRRTRSKEVTEVLAFGAALLATIFFAVWLVLLPSFVNRIIEFVTQGSLIAKSIIVIVTVLTFGSIVGALALTYRWWRLVARDEPFEFPSTWSLEKVFTLSAVTTFNERKWVFNEIDKRNKHQLLLLTGPAGMGKTEIAWQLTRRPNVLAYHFCDHSKLITLGAIPFVRNLATMFAKNLPGYRELIATEPYRDALKKLKKDNASEYGIAFHLKQIISAPVGELNKTRGWHSLIIIDALDETTGPVLDRDSGGTVASALKDCLAALPSNVRIIATTRADRDVFDTALPYMPDAGRPSFDEIKLEMPSPSSFDFEQNHVVKDTKEFIEALYNKEKGLASSKLHNVSQDVDHEQHVKGAMHRILTTSRGNFLLTRLNFEAFANDPLLPVDQMPFAADLNARYRLTFERLFGDRSEARYTSVVRAFLATILATEDTESLSLETLRQAVCTTGTPLKENEIEREIKIESEINQLYGRLEAFLPQPEERIAIFHKSFSDWLTSDHAGPFKINKRDGEQLLTELCLRTLQSIITAGEGVDIRYYTGEPNSYLRRHGIRHFLAGHPPNHPAHFAEAVRYAHLLLNTKGDPADGRNGLSLARTPPAQHLARTVLLALDKCSDAERIDPDHLADLVIGVYQIEPLPPALRILVEHHYAPLTQRHMGLEPKFEKPPILDRLLSTENYVLRYELSNVLGDACAIPTSSFTLESIRNYLHHKDINYRELGCNALRRYYVNPANNAAIEVDLLKELGDDKTYVGRQVLGEILLNLALQRRSVTKEVEGLDPSLLQERRMMWEHNCQNILDLRAIDAFWNKSDAPRPTNDKTYDHLVATENIRATFVGRLGIAASKIRALFELEMFYNLGGDPKPIRDAESEFIKLDNAALHDVMYLLFSHPSWNVGETAASILASIFETTAETKKLTDIKDNIIKALWNEAYDWRVHLGAIETAYILAEAGIEESLFFDAVEKFHDDDSCRVRSLCAENLITLVLERSRTEWAKQLNQPNVRKYVARWLVDDDCWVLEHVFGLATELQGARYDCDVVLGSKRSRLLEDMSFSDWARLSRGQFLKRIEDKKREVAGYGNHNGTA